MRKSVFFCLVAFLLFVTTTVGADTIHLKNGSIIKGKVASYADDQFIVLLDTGSARYISRAMIYIGDVARIEFDSTSAPAGAESSQVETSPSSSSPRDGAGRDTSQRRTQTVDPEPRLDTSPVSAPPTSTSREPARETVKEKEAETNPTAGQPVSNPPAATEVSESAPPPRKPTGPVKTVNIDVSAKRDWTSSGLIVKRGDRIRITAVGAVVLDAVSGQTSGPEGIDLTDPRKLMTDRPTGALIGVIGADNDEFIFVGRSAEFTATRDGLLFLSVNEGALADNQGTYKATIEVQTQGRRQ